MVVVGEMAIIAIGMVPALSYLRVTIPTCILVKQNTSVIAHAHMYTLTHTLSLLDNTCSIGC